MNLRGKGDVSSVVHTSNFIRQGVKAQFDPDFGDRERPRPDQRLESPKENERIKRGIYSQQPMKRAAKYYLCGEEHRILHCSILLDCDVKDRIQMIRDMKLCFAYSDESYC